MNYSSIDIQGNIVSSDILTKIKDDDIRFQKASDFGLEANTPLRDEIGVAWSLAQAHWKAFSLRRERLKDADSGTSETRQGWMVPFMRELGYDIESAKSYVINEKTYAISHKATNRDDFPIHIVGINQSLDKRAEFGTRLSPHALVQEFLNNHEHLYAIVSNGKYLRLLRDATRLARLSYLEFNLEQMMEEELYAEFAILFRVLHSSRMPEKEDAGEDAIIEFYHQEALASGTRIRERLSQAVEQSIKLLANGLLKKQSNQELRNRAIEGDLKPDDYFLYMLRTVYRMLFLLVIEERNLIYPAERNAELSKKRDIYYKYYSIQRLTKLVESAIYVDPNKTDLWQSLMTNFLIFENGHYGEKLGIAPLGSGLFSPNALSDIPDQQMSNEILLQVLKYLVMFENEQGQLTRVNYADLDVEEFGSVYEGLLEYDPVISYGEESHELMFSFKKGDDRSSSGSHYTPEELVKPLIKHSLDYIIEEKLKVEPGLERRQKLTKQANNLLTITVCDVACGSGHILLSAARRIGFELAKITESLDQNDNVEQPSPPYLRQAIREVIKYCIYGVDLNPLAVELCKVAFWLEAHNPGEPLNFLDHHIKNGNAIVGLAHLDDLTEGIATEAFKTLPGDDKDIAANLRKKNSAERKAREKNKQQGAIAKRLAEENIQKVTNQLNDWAKLPENTPTQIEAKAKAYNKITKSPQWYRLQQLADTQVAQFFLPKTNTRDLVTDGQYYQYLISANAIQSAAVSLATGKSFEKKFFHWFLEFPEVFSKGGFDCIIGNPPYLGGTKISTSYGESMQYYLTNKDSKVSGHADLVSYFFRRSRDIINTFGFFSFITTNSISQGDTREYALEDVLQSGLIINFCIPSMVWPGKAEVHVSLVTFCSNSQIPKYIRTEIVDNITSYLSDDLDLAKPNQLSSNSNLGFLGHYINGTGFMLSIEEGKKILLEDSNYSQVVKPYINGKGLNSSPLMEANRFVIYFDEMTKEEASSFKGPFQIVKDRVYPERMKKDAVKYPRMVFEWWKFWNNRQLLTKALSKYSHVLAVARVSKTLAFAIVDKNQIFDEMLVVIPSNNPYSDFAILQSSFHHSWAWKYCTTMKADLRYTPERILSTFVFPTSHQNLDEISKSYYDIRSNLMVSLNLGLTKFYNLFHDRSLTEHNELNILRVFHKGMDEAVLAAYGWHEDSEKWGKAIELRHDFYEVDYLPDNDRVRYTIHPAARKEVLKRLLLLNHECFELEAKQGLHNKKDVEAFYEQKGQSVPEEITFIDQKRKPTHKKAKPVSTQTKGQSVLFEEKNLFNSEPSKKAIAKGSSFLMAPVGGSPDWYCIDAKFPGTRTLESSSNLGKAVLGKKTGDRVDFGTGFQILEVR